MVEIENRLNLFYKGEMRVKPFIYYYTNSNGDNIPLVTGTDDNFEHMLWFDEESKEKMRQDFPDAIGRLYLFVDGKDFKVEI